MLLLLLLRRFSHVRLCDPIDGSPPGSPVPGILQARTLEWVAISFSNAWKWKVKGKSLSRARLFATPWTAAYRLLRPWDSPGKSTGVGCHCLLRFLSYLWSNRRNLSWQVWSQEGVSSRTEVIIGHIWNSYYEFNETLVEVSEEQFT